MLLGLSAPIDNVNPTQGRRAGVTRHNQYPRPPKTLYLKVAILVWFEVRSLNKFVPLRRQGWLISILDPWWCLGLRWYECHEAEISEESPFSTLSHSLHIMILTLVLNCSHSHSYVLSTTHTTSPHSHPHSASHSHTQSLTLVVVQCKFGLSIISRSLFKLPGIYMNLSELLMCS